MITHFFQFQDQVTALSQLSAYAVNGAWRPDIVDASIPIQSPAGSGDLKAGYFLNIALPALNSALSGLTGAGYRNPVTKAWVTVHGAAPASAPQREFMA